MATTVLSISSSSENLMDKWRIDLSPEPTMFYGYGYGNFNDGSSLDYFNVLGIWGTNTGYGIDGSQTGGTIGSYGYGWGFEYGNAIYADLSQRIKMVATVYKNGVRQEGIRVQFTSKPGLILEENSVFTDSNGEAFIYVQVDTSFEENIIQRTKDEDGVLLRNEKPLSVYGTFSVKATINMGPDYLDGTRSISCHADALFYEDSISTINVSSYAYQNV